MPKQREADPTTLRSIESLSTIKDHLYSACNRLTVHDDIYRDYSSQLKELRAAVDNRLKAYLLQKHEEENSPYAG